MKVDSERLGIGGTGGFQRDGQPAVMVVPARRLETMKDHLADAIVVGFDVVVQARTGPADQAPERNMATTCCFAVIRSLAA